jgi:hypothetical protein
MRMLRFTKFIEFTFLKFLTYYLPGRCIRVFLYTKSISNKTSTYNELLWLVNFLPLPSFYIKEWLENEEKISGIQSVKFNSYRR